MFFEKIKEHEGTQTSLGRFYEYQAGSVRLKKKVCEGKRKRAA